MQRRDPTVSLRLIGQLVDLTPEQKLIMVRDRIKRYLTILANRCADEAAGLNHDTEVIIERLKDNSFLADIKSMKVAGYHICQTKLEATVDIYQMICSVMNGLDREVETSEEE